MPEKIRFFLNTHLIMLLLAACASSPDPGAQIQSAVMATVAAIPTQTPYPTPATQPIPTKIDLAGLFCEYQFCIGHPPEVAFFDVSAQRDPLAPSNFTQGLLAAYNAKLFIELIWQHAPGTSDPKFMLDLILDDNSDESTGNLDIMLIRNMNVMYVPVATSSSEVLPYGGAAAWTCGDRVFAWKAYTPGTGQAEPLFDEALQRFQCNQN